MENHLAIDPVTGVAAARLPTTGPTGTPDAPAVDSESAALFRAWMRPLFDDAASWKELIAALANKGYGLAIRDGRLVLTDGTSGARVCTARFLGTNLRDLAERMGRARVRARHDRPAAGEFTAHCGVAGLPL